MEDGTNNQSANALPFIFLDLGQNGQCLLSLFRRLSSPKMRESIRLNLTVGCSHRPSMITGLLRRTAQGT